MSLFYMHQESHLLQAHMHAHTHACTHARTHARTQSAHKHDLIVLVINYPHDSFTITIPMQDQGKEKASEQRRVPAQAV